MVSNYTHVRRHGEDQTFNRKKKKKRIILVWRGKLLIAYLNPNNDRCLTRCLSLTRPKARINL